MFPSHRLGFDARWILAAAIAGTIVVDQITKWLAIHALSSGPVAIGGLRLHLVANRGILLGFPAPASLIVLATVGVVVMALRSTDGSRLTTATGYGLLAGGALGNLADRLQSRQFFPAGAVVDWISVGRITFNLADVFLVAGVAMLLLLKEPRDSARAD